MLECVCLCVGGRENDEEDSVYAKKEELYFLFLI